MPEEKRVKIQKILSLAAEGADTNIPASITTRKRTPSPEAIERLSKRTATQRSDPEMKCWTLCDNWTPCAIGLVLPNVKPSLDLPIVCDDDQRM